MTAASVALFPLLAGPRRTTRVLGIVTGAVYLQIDPMPAAEASDHKDHPGAVVALLDRDAVQLPFGIVLPEAAAGFIPVSVAGAPVSQGEITVGWGSIQVAEHRWPVLRWWNPGVPKLTLPTDPLSIRSNRIEDVDFALPAVPDEVTEGLAALAAGEVERAVRLLIGAGPGLTPAGDDVLCGALAALAAWVPDSAARRDLAQLVIDAVGGTTAISAALLNSAVAGCVVPQLGRLLTAISTGGSEDFDQAVRELSQVGASSGAAMAAGAVHQYRLLTRIARRAA